MKDIGKLIWAKLGTAPSWIQTYGAPAAALLIGFAPMMSFRLRVGAIVLAVAISLTIAAVAGAKESRVEQLEQDLKDLQEAHAQCPSEMEDAARKVADAKDEDYADYIAFLCQDRLALLLHQITACFSSSSLRERRAKISSARTSILNATADLVGNTGTRANIFKLIEDDDDERMEPEAFWGRGDESIRVFRPGMTTFDESKKGKSQFISLPGRDEDGEELAYETYLTYPIKEGTGRLYGVLTVDCVNAGELSDVPDRAKMSVLAAMLALTYKADGLRISAATT